jgi:hypothetical protein
VPSVEREPAGTPRPAPLALGDLERSDPPRVAYVRGHVLHRPDGSELTIHLGLRGRWGITSVAPVEDGYLVTDDRWFEGSVGMHRLDSDGDVVASWTSTGPALVSPTGEVVWVSVMPPESGETGATELHSEVVTQRLPRLIWPVLSRYDAGVVTFTALRREGKDWNRRGFATDLRRPPHRIPTPSGRTRSPDGRHWWVFRRTRLVIGGEQGEVELRSRPFLQSFGRPVWEDDAHLLATVTDGPRQAIARIDLDGTATLASGWSPFTNAGFTFVPGPVSAGARRGAPRPPCGRTWRPGRRPGWST